ncbi:MAG: hypothetical protein MZU97_18950 [Bacillus subtilis]|nr:hypothetical protein [Bacillus subtilis]
MKPGRSGMTPPSTCMRRYDTRSGALGADLRFESLYLSRIGYPSGRRASSWAPWFRSPYSGRIALEREESSKDPRLDVEVSGSLPPDSSGTISHSDWPPGGRRGWTWRLLKSDPRTASARVHGTFRPDLSSVALIREVDYRARDGRLPVPLGPAGGGRRPGTFPCTPIRPRSGRGESSQSWHFPRPEIRGPSISARKRRHSLDPIRFRTDGHRRRPGSEAAGKQVSWEGSLILGAEPLPGSLGRHRSLRSACLSDPCSPPFWSRQPPGRSRGAYPGREDLPAVPDFSEFPYSASDFRIAPSGTAGRETFAVLNLHARYGLADLAYVSRFIASLHGELLSPAGRAFGCRVPIPPASGFRTGFSYPRDIPYVFQGEYDDRRRHTDG